MGDEEPRAQRAIPVQEIHNYYRASLRRLGNLSLADLVFMQAELSMKIWQNKMMQIFNDINSWASLFKILKDALSRALKLTAPPGICTDPETYVILKYGSSIPRPQSRDDVPPDDVDYYAEWFTYVKRQIKLAVAQHARARTIFVEQGVFLISRRERFEAGPPADSIHASDPERWRLLFLREFQDAFWEESSTATEWFEEHEKPDKITRLP